ncbi:MAG: AAA family ATPase [Aeriscardovia sp.]|nr:AAA family ATPase [Aeriscardovia sp.]
MRGCGKSTLLTECQGSFLESGANKERIVSLNFEDLNCGSLSNYRELYNFLQEKLIPDTFPDEVQRVLQFEKAVGGL